MRHPPFVAAAIALAVALVVPGPCRTADAARRRCLAIGMSTPFLVAHRGASAYAPEHTLAAYRLALEQGADYVEQDLTLTKDGVLVCLHDDTLERTTDVEARFPDRAVVEPGARRPAGEAVVRERLHARRAEDAGRRLVVRRAVRRRARSRRSRRRSRW